MAAEGSVHPEVMVREARGDDLAVIGQLATLAVDEQREGRGGAVWSRREARADAESSISAAMESETTRVFVGLLDEVVVAYAVFSVETLTDGGQLGRIEDLFVAPEGRGIGLGEALMESVTDAARAARCFGIDAFVLPGNRVAKNFFEASGLTARAIIVHRSLD